MRHTNLVNLDCGQIATFTVKYEPYKEVSVDAVIKLHIVNNPFETKTIYLCCNGFYVDVIFEELQPYTKSISIGSLNEEISVIGYSVSFGSVPLNTLVKECFTIKNNSDMYTYKFEFPAFNEILFTPAVGHLPPKAKKQILATFLSKTPVTLSDHKINCSIYKIEYAEPQTRSLSWDDRQHLVAWIPETVEGVKDYDSKNESTSSARTTEENKVILKKIEENPEPEYSMVPLSWQNIALFLTISANYAVYSCDVSELSIPDTFIMSKQTVSFDVKNPGTVSLKLSWTITMRDLPQRLNSSRSLENLSSATNVTVPISSKTRPAPLRGDEHFLYGEPTVKRSTSYSTLFSSDTMESSRSSDSWVEDRNLPFFIKPETVIIGPKRKETFTVTFAPVDVYSYSVQLKGVVDHRSPDTKDIEIEVKARSMLPLYCFELEPTNYIEEKRRGKKLCQDLYDENTKVIEFESVGVGVICTRKFLLKNPTKNTFFYEWKPAQNINPHISCYHCHTPNGTVDRGMSVEIVFSFIPQDYGVFEEFYLFSIPTSSIQVTFLLAGTAREPRIYFDQVFVDLPPTIVGSAVSKTIILKNTEDEDYNFKFEKLPMLSVGLSVEPFNGGYIESHENLPITISYNPSKKTSATFDLKCFVDKIKKPLTLTVSCNCYEIQALVSYTERNGKEIQIFPSKVNNLNLGAMVPRQKYETVFVISNIGQVDFGWFWSMNNTSLGGIFNITVDTKESKLSPSEQSRVTMTVEPLIKSKMKLHKIYLKIHHGPVYILQLNGSAERPPFKLSFLEYDFGSCLVQKAPSKYYKTCLKFSNCNVWPMTIEKGSHINHVSVNFKSSEIPAQSHKEIIVYFHPLTIGQHSLEIPFYVDGKRSHVTIFGKAVPLKLEFVNQTDKFIDLGSVLVGKTSARTVRVLNDGECPINVVFNFFGKLPKIKGKDIPLESIEIPIEEPVKVKQRTKKGKKGSKGSKKSKKSGKSIQGSKKSKKSGKNSKLTKTTKKSKNKTKKTVTGSKKSKKSNTKSSKTTKKSDKKSKKSDESSKKRKEKKPKSNLEETTELVTLKRKQGIDFITISPEKSVKVLPKSVTEFSITFQPEERVEPFTEKLFYRVQDYIEAFCIIKGSSIGPECSLDRQHLTFGNVVVGFERKMNVVLRNTGDIALKFKWLLDKLEENFSITPRKGCVPAGQDLVYDIIFKPTAVKCSIKTKLICLIQNINKQLELTLFGSCISLPPPSATLAFICPVRGYDKKEAVIFNPTNLLWELRPTISGDTYFHSQDTVHVKGNCEGKCEITYSPLETKEHNATLTFPTPDGSVISYILKGIAKPPLPIGHIKRDIPCKVAHTENLTVRNWLQIKQQFQVFTTINERVTAKKLYTVGGNELIDVPRNSSRNYQWIVTPIIEGPLELKVTFMNKTTLEYQFYEISLNVLPNKNLDLIEISACVRESRSKIIKLENPVNVSIAYSITCAHDYLEFEKSVTLEPHSVYYLELVYKPLKTEHVTKLLEASCEQLGVFSYNVVLTANPPVPEPPIFFKTFFGQGVSQKVEVVRTTDATFEFDNHIFSLEKIHSDTLISVNFEPDSVAQFQGCLILKSSLLGEFIYPLIGECCSPKPQGPFLINSTNPLTINFKNPFTEEKIFFFHVEPSDFRIKEHEETIPAKKTHKITVSISGKKVRSKMEFPVTGKLMIYCKNPDTFWVYYLKENLE